MSKETKKSTLTGNEKGLSRSAKTKQRRTRAMIAMFYSAVKMLLADVAWLASANGLATHPDSESTAAVLRQNYWHGQQERLERSAKERRGACFQDVIAINAICARCGLKQIENADKVIDDLLNPDLRRGYEKIVDRFMAEGKLVSFYQIERDYSEEVKAEVDRQARQRAAQQERLRKQAFREYQALIAKYGDQPQDPKLAAAIEGARLACDNANAEAGDQLRLLI